MTFKKRKIDVTFKVGKGEYGDQGFDTVKLSGLRCIVDIAQAGGISKGALNLRVYGMPLELMNKLSRVGRIAPSTRQNIVTVEVGDDVSMSTVFSGSIFIAWIDFQGAPDVCLNVEAAAGWYESNKPATPISVKGVADVAQLAGDIAKAMGYTFVNNGVTAKLANPYLPGTGWDQLVAVCQAADINFNLDRETVHIWNKGEYRQSDLLTISAEQGMYGYPKFNDNGISLNTEFSPAIVSGGLINVQSSLLPACGVWVVNLLSHNLASEMPGGPWFTNIECSRYDKPTIVAR